MAPKLTRATAAQASARDALTHPAWGDRLTLEHYLAREARLRAHRWSTAGMSTWLLEGDDGEVLASCESFRCDSWWRGERGVSFAIASVFTEERLRGRGYATTMMQALMQRLASGDDAPGRTAGPTHAVHLYSEVGPTIYERAGFVARPSFDWVAPPSKGAIEGVCDAALSEGAIGGAIEGAIDRAIDRAGAPGDAFVIWPSADQIDWHLERERFYAGALGRARPRCHGARVGDAMAVWAADFKIDRLRVLALVASGADAAAALYEAARRAAGEAGLAGVIAWEDEQNAGWFPGEPARRAPRPDALPMIRPVAPGLRAEDFRRVPRALWT